MSEDFWRAAVPELYQLREDNAALRAEVERLQREIFQDQDERGSILAEVERLQAELVELRALADKRTRDERDGWCEREGECWLADGPCAGHDRHREGPLLQNIADDDARSAQHVDELYATIDDLTAEVERLRDERRWRAIVVEPPPPSTIVVAFDGEVFESHYSTRCGWTALRDGLPRTPTHWMPLPAPPEKEE